MTFFASKTQIPLNKLTQCPSGLPAFGLTLMLFAPLAGTLRFWGNDMPVLWSAGSHGAFIGLLLCIIGLVLQRPKNLTEAFEPGGFAAALLFILISDWTTRSYSLLPAPLIRGEILLFALLSFFALKHEAAKRALRWLVPLVMLLLCVSLLLRSGGRVIFHDDHTTFIYRLELLKQNFPHIPFYHPLWNAGIEARDFFATGALNAYFIFLPLIELFPITDIYTLLVGLLLFGILPLSVYFAARLESASREAASLAALLAVASSLAWYRWGLKYGTLGFVTTTTLVPLNLALARRLISRPADTSWKLALLCLASFTLMLFWSPSALIFIPVAALALRHLWHMLSQKQILGLMVGLIILNLPWMLTFYSVSNVGSFIQSEAPATHSIDGKEPLDTPPPVKSKTFKHRATPFSTKATLKALRDNAISANPLLLLFTVSGLMLLARPARIYYGLTLLWLLVMGLTVPHIKPQMEFDRMLVVLLLCGSLPAGFALERLLWTPSASTSRRVLAALCAGVLFAALLCVNNIIMNRSLEQYSFARPVVNNMIQAIKTYGGDGRVLFSGFVLHDLNNGHLAPLSVHTGKPLVASSQAHDQWKYKQIIPAEFMEKGDSGITEFLDLMNASSVMAHEARWIEYFSSRPESFREVWQGEKFHLFKRLGYKSDYFLRGKGEVISQDTNSVHIRLGAESALIKFKYFSFLESSACKLRPVRISEELEFTEIYDCQPGTEVTIKSIGPAQRFGTILRTLSTQLWSRLETALKVLGTRPLSLFGAG